MRQTFKITKYNYINPKVTRPLRIVVIADLHNQVYGAENTELLAFIRQAAPDLILLPGDMVVCRKKECANNMKTAETVCRLTETAPVYYEYGNHERGLLEEIRETEGCFAQYEARLKDCPNLHFLVNTHAYLPEFNIDLYGLDLSRDYYKRLFKKPLNPDTLVQMLGTPDTERCNILLAHNPDYFRAYVGYGADLVLSGHNHGGMIRLPGLGGVISPRLHPFPKYDYGRYSRQETTMFVTSGCGMHSIHVRINNQPEIVWIDVNKM